MTDKLMPFDKAYVLKTTFNHMIKCVEISLDKTMDRLKTFGDDPDKATEAVETISQLYGVKRALEATRNANIKKSSKEINND